MALCGYISESTRQKQTPPSSLESETPLRGAISRIIRYRSSQAAHARGVTLASAAASIAWRCSPSSRGCARTRAGAAGLGLAAASRQSSRLGTCSASSSWPSRTSPGAPTTPISPMPRITEAGCTWGARLGMPRAPAPSEPVFHGLALLNGQCAFGQQLGGRVGLDHIARRTGHSQMVGG